MLAEAVISDLDSLPEVLCSKEDYNRNSEKRGCSNSQILKWIYMSDLFTIKGLG